MSWLMSILPQVQKRTNHRPPPMEAIAPACEVCRDVMTQKDMEDRPGKTICWLCEKAQIRKQQKEKARQAIADKSTYSTGLLDLLLNTNLGTKSLLSILDSAGAEVSEYDEILEVLTPLIDRQEATFEKIARVISDTLGDIQVLVCRESMQLDDKYYGTEEFYQAILKPKESHAGGQKAQG